jgi:hypothetical protein
MLTEVRFESEWTVTRRERSLLPGDEDMTGEEFLIHCFKDSPNLESILRRERRAAKRLERKNRRKNKGKQEAPTDDSYELIRIPHGLRTLREGVFSYCIHLERVELPDTLRQIDKHAFLGCTSLKKLIIPEGTLSIGSRAFEGCRLEDVFIPASVTKIADDAFIGASRFTLHTPRGSEAARFAKKNPIRLRYSDLPRRNKMSRFFRRLGKKTSAAATRFSKVFKKEN